MINILNSSEWMQFSFGFFISLMCFYCCIKSAKLIMSSINHNSSFKFLSITFCPRNSKITSCIVYLRSYYILPILTSIRNSKIFPSRIAFIVIYMVNFFTRKLPIHIKPCKSMAKIKFVINSYNKITKFIFTSCNCSSFSSITSIYKSCKNTSFRIVVKNRHEFSLCKHFEHPYTILSELCRLITGISSDYLPALQQPTSRLYHKDLWKQQDGKQKMQYAPRIIGLRKNK